MTNNKIKVIFIDGNISVGKSTVIKKLCENNDNMISITEPINEFTLLSKFNSHVDLGDELKEVLDYGFQLEVCVVIYNLITSRINDSSKIYVVERNPYLRNIVFSADKKFSTEQRNTINKFNTKILDYMNENFEYNTFFLDCDFSEKRNRLVKRGKGDIPESYHKIIDDNYNKYINCVDHITIFNNNIDETSQTIMKKI